MKKITLLLLIITATTNAQFSAGPRTGVAIPKTESGTRPSIYIGGFMDYKFSDWSGEFDLTYSNQGSKGQFIARETPTAPENIYNGKTDVHVITASFLAKYNFSDKFSIKAGPYAGIVAAARMTADEPDDIQVDVKDSFSSLDYGIEFGLQAAIYKKLFAEARYSTGLADFNTEYKTSLISIGLGMKF